MSNAPAYRLPTLPHCTDVAALRSVRRAVGADIGPPYGGKRPGDSAKRVAQNLRFFPRGDFDSNSDATSKKIVSRAIARDLS